jgi:uncharacterized protein YdhG (YjbR/CyaY superfamily)
MSELDEYLDTLDDETRAAATRVYDQARALVPDAVEARSYGMPALTHAGLPFVAVQARRGHLSYYPYSGSVVAALAERLEAALPGSAAGKGTVRFTVARPLPDDVLDALILARRDEIDATA